MRNKIDVIPEEKEDRLEERLKLHQKTIAKEKLALTPGQNNKVASMPKAEKQKKADLDMIKHQTNIKGFVTVLM